MTCSKKHLIYCPIFRDELQAIVSQLDGLTTSELSYDVHNHPELMMQQLQEGIWQAQQKNKDFSILVGKDCECSQPISEIVQQQDGRVPNRMNCFEIFLGKEKTLELQQNRTVLMNPGWLTMIKTTLDSGLWTVEDARISLGWYDRILLLDTGVTRISDEEIMEFYDLIQVPIEMMEIDLDHFRKVVDELLS
jgi:hypothetical protein